VKCETAKVRIIKNDTVVALLLLTFHENEKAILRTGRPLTIACHMKKTYFFVVSPAAVVAESGLAVRESGVVVTESGAGEAGAVVVVSLFSVPVPPSLQDATNAPIAKTNRSFFICTVFCFINR
jgi:hypothetical protein